MLSAAWLSLVLCAAWGDGGPPPTLAVMMLDAKQGVHHDTAELLTDAVVDAVRRSKRFKRVASQAEVRDALGLEQAKQLMQCDQSSCLAEIAGALGSELVLTGSVGKLGEIWLFTLRMLDTKTGQAVASTTKNIEGKSEAELVRAVGGMVEELLGQKPVSAVTPAKVGQATPQVAPTEKQGSPLRLGVMVGGGVALGVGVLAAVVGVVLMAAAVGTKAFLNLGYNAALTPVLSRSLRAVQVAYAGSAVLGLVLVVGAVLGAAAGIALLGVGGVAL